MSSSLQFIKIWVMIAGVIIIGAGAASLGVFLRYFKDYQAIPYEQAEKIGKYCVITISVIAGVFMLVGLIGIIGAIKKSSCLLGIFNVSVVIFLCIFIGFAIAGLISYQSQQFLFRFILRSYLKTNLNCNSGDLLFDANDAVYDASQIFCTNLCPCRVDDPNLLQEISAVHPIVTSSNGVTRVQDCENYDQYAQEYSDIISSMEWVENNFDCSGICTAVEFYMFTDINRGMPRIDCESKIYTAGQHYSERVAIFSIVIAAFLFICLIFSIILCCMKKPENDETVKK